MNLTPDSPRTEDAPYTVSEARYSHQSNGKRNRLVRLPRGDGWKKRADRLLTALNCRWTGRESGYVLSDSKLARFEKLYAEGWDANSFAYELRPPQISP